MEVLEDSGTVV